MKFISYIKLLFYLFSISLCEETNNITETDDPSIKLAELEEKLGKNESKLQDSPEEIEKRRAENDKKFKEKIKSYLKEKGLENETKITREQFKDLYFKLLEYDKNKETAEKNGENKSNEENMSIVKEFAIKIFDILVNKDLEYIEVDKIESYFDTKNVLIAFKEILKGLGLGSLIDVFSGPLMESFGNIFNSDNNTNSSNITNGVDEKIADL